MLHKQQVGLMLQSWQLFSLATLLSQEFPKGLRKVSHFLPFLGTHGVHCTVHSRAFFLYFSLGSGSSLFFVINFGAVYILYGISQIKRSPEPGMEPELRCGKSPRCSCRLVSNQTSSSIKDIQNKPSCSPSVSINHPILRLDEKIVWCLLCCFWI